MTDASANVTHTEWNVRNQKTLERTPRESYQSADPLERQSDYAYDAEGNPTTVTGPRSAAPGGARPTTQSVYGLRGLRAAYFNNKDLSAASGGRAGVYTDPNVDFTSGEWAGAPRAGVNADNFSVRWSGYLWVAQGGDYTLQAAFDNGVRVYVDGVRWIEDWTNSPPQVLTSPAYPLAAGAHRVVVEMNDTGGPAQAVLSDYPDPGGGRGTLSGVEGLIGRNRLPLGGFGGIIERMFEHATLDDLTTAATHLTALANAVHAQLLVVLAEIEAREGYRGDGALTMPAWVATACNVDAATAREWVETSRALGRLPALGRVAAEGRLGPDQLHQLARYATPENDTELAATAPGLSVAELRAAARAAAPPTATDAAAAHRRRALGWRWSEGGDEVRLWGRLPAAEGAQVLTAVEALAARGAPDPGTGGYEAYPARCADALVTLATAEAGSAGAGTLLVVHVDADVLDGGPGVARSAEAVLAGETARRIACDTRWQPVADDPQGRPVATGPTRGNIPLWLRRHLRHRDRHCRFPGCGHTRNLHAHHVVPRARGGPHSPQNCFLACARHHHLLHEGGWRARGSPEDDTLTFHRPDGTPLHTSAPPPLLAELRARLGLLPLPEAPDALAG